MKLNNKFFNVLQVFFLITVNLLFYLQINPYYLTTIQGFIYLFFYPGFIFTSYLKIKTSNIWEKLIFSLGLSLAFLLTLGYLTNLILPYFKINRPLDFLPLFIEMTIIILPLSIIQLFKTKKELIIQTSKIQLLYKFVSVIIITFTVLGVISLNNGSSNIFSVLAIAIIAFFFLYLLFAKQKASENSIIFFLLSISISMLLSQSLRSWHINGWDINEEFEVFQIAKFHGIWNVNSFKDPYNLCLSITILPTLISQFLDINSEYIFKLIYPLLFSFVPVILYQTYKRYFNNKIVYLSVFYFISEPWFIQPMTALNRQEIALIFFSLILFVITNNDLTSFTKKNLFLIFGISLIISHYSTTYVTLSILILSYIIIKLLNISLPLFAKKINKIQITHINIPFSFASLFILCIFTFLWNSQLDSSINNIKTIIQDSTSSISKIFLSDTNNPQITNSISINLINVNYLTLLNEYEKIHVNNNYSITQDKYNPSTYKKISLGVLPDDTFYTPKTENLNLITFFNILKFLAKVFLVVGSLWVIFKNKFLVKNEYKVLMLVGLSFLFIILALPSFASQYNLTRAYLQVLIIISFGTVIGIYTFLFFLKENIKLIIIGVFLFLFFIYQSALISQFIGGYSNMHLNNIGEEYDMFYTYTQEVQSAKWLQKNHKENIIIFADQLANLRLMSFAEINNASNIILPSAFYKNSYVYEDYINTTKDKCILLFNGATINYQCPNTFLNENKNLIYNNGGSKIYK